MKGKNGKRRKPHFTSPVSYLCSAGFTRSQASALLKKGPDALDYVEKRVAKAEPASVPRTEMLERQLRDVNLELSRKVGQVDGLESAIRIFAGTRGRE